MKKLLIIASGALTYLVFSIVLTSYDHISTHKKINAAITEGFTGRYSARVNPASTFYNYRFGFAGNGGLEGEAISKGDLLEVETTTTTKNVTGWIEHGGYSADEPELPASFVHFYDPTQDEGERYLKDLLDGFFLSWSVENPKTDHVEWAISDERNEYNYEAAKTHFKNALEQSDPGFRKLNMAFAWRAFGQTLHLIADMGIASHVRDDAHPGVGIKSFSYRWKYDADPYEEIVAVHTTKNGIEPFLTGTVDPEVEDFAQGAKTTKSIAEQLAAYTNKYFFSHETISGKDVIPKIHPKKTYPSPKLESCSYNSSSNVYSKDIGGNEVKMCKDLSYLAIRNGFRGYPYIDEECVVSQATALIPQIREAGINALRCFIPKIEIKITALGDNFIEGEVKHKVNEEYKTEIKYNGPVTIRNASSLVIIAEVNCENGVIKDGIDLSAFDRANEQLFAEIECGYVYIKSEPFVDSPSPTWNAVMFNLGNVPAYLKHTKLPAGTVTYSDFNISWRRDQVYHPGIYADGIFTSTWDNNRNYGYNNKGTITVTFDEKTRKITGGTIHSEMIEIESPDETYYVIDIELHEITADGWDTRYGQFQLAGDEICNTNYIANIKYEDSDYYGGAIHINTLESYSCEGDLFSIFSLQFKKE